MYKLFFLVWLFASSLLLLPQVEAQRVYPQSRVVNGKIITDYYYDYLPGEPTKGRAYRENGKIKYEPTRPPPYNYYPNYYNSGYYRYQTPSYSYPTPGYGNYYYPSTKGKPYRDSGGKIRYP